MIYNSISDAIGNTPLIRLSKIEKVFDIDVEIYAKFESRRERKGQGGVKHDKAWGHHRGHDHNRAHQWKYGYWTRYDSCVMWNKCNIYNARHHVI